MANKDTPLIVIIGPTAVGKTEISLRLAEIFNGEIISADSRLFYRGMDIGTAKPTQEERDRIPHYLIDVSAPDQVWSLALYLPEAYYIIRDIQKRGHLPFLVGGTGQYIQAIIEGWDLPAVQPDPGLRGVLNKWAEQIGVNGLRQRLQVLDPEAAEGIDGPNLRRMIRAMEVIFTSGEKFSQQKGKSGSLFNILQIGLNRPREELYQRIDQRIDRMINDGLVKEVEKLLEKGYSPELSSMSAIGYKQIVSFLREEITLEEAINQIRSKTRKYVRQQTNWFNENAPEIHWFSATTDPTDEIIQIIQQYL